MCLRCADHPSTDKFTTLNTISSAGAFALGTSTLSFGCNLFVRYRFDWQVAADNPRRFGSSVRSATSCLPPRHDFTELLRIRPERPTFDLHCPRLAERARAEAHAGRGGQADPELPGAR